MAQDVIGTIISLKAADTSICAWRVACISAKNTCDIWQTSTSKILGLTINDASNTGDAVGIIISGVGRAVCGASVSVGAVVCPATDTGKVIEIVVDAYTMSTTSVYSKSVGIALQSGSTNSVISVLVMPNNINKIG